MNETSCCLCEQKDFSLLHNKGRNNKKVENFVCNNCGFIMVLPRPNMDFFDEKYKDSQFSIEARGSQRPDKKKLAQTDESANERFKYIAQYDNEWLNEVQSTETKRFLEVGCGTGSFMRLMKSIGWETEAIEPDGDYTASVQEDFGLNIKDAYLEEFETDKKYDFIASFHVIEHVLNPDAFLAKCHELLKENGKLMIECPAIDKIYGESVDFFFWDVHINTFSKQTLSAFLVKNGFNLLEHNWQGNFINILCEKVKQSAEDYTQYFEDASISRNRVKAYNPSSSSKMEKIKSGFSKLRSEPEETLGKLSTRVQDIIGRKTQTTLLKDQRSGGDSLMHIAHFTTSNAGDTILPVILRDLFAKEKPIRWKTQHAHTLVDAKSLTKINSTKGLVIGGGGLFLKDTNPNELSGWQWSCSMDALEKIKTPIALFAVGYNRFRGQSDFAPIFTKHVTRVAEKSVMIGLRNYGSIENVKKYLPENLHDKLVFQPCMTTLSSHIYGEKVLRALDTPPFIAVNCAFDRSNLRFGENIGKSLSNLALGLKKASKIVPIKYYAHTPKDEHFLPFLDSFEVHYELVKLYRKSPKFVLDAYKAPLIALGMRGHAQLVPFGSQRPIISLISHNKLRYFLDDIGANEWGVEMQDEHLADLLAEKVQEMLDNLPAVENQVKAKQKVLWDITQANVTTIKKTFNL